MEEIKGYIKCMINLMKRVLASNPKNFTAKSTIEDLKGLLKLIEEKELTSEIEVQKQVTNVQIEISNLDEFKNLIAETIDKLD